MLEKPLTIKEITPEIKSLLGDNRALIFAWQCVMQDGEVKQAEIDAFNELANLFSVKDEDLKNIKHKATQFAKLDNPQMLQEYFKS